MADSQNAPLSDAERAELEELRAEKARREVEERARRERAELEALRAEKAAASASSDPASAPKPAARPVNQPAPAPRPVSRRVSEPAPAPQPGEKTFGQRMVTTDATDDDGIPKMPPAQKIILAVCALLVVAFVVWNFVK